MSDSSSSPRLQLVIGNKNYSSWSMRPWVLLTQFGIPFEEIMIRFDGFTPDSKFKQTLAQHTPTGRVPVLIDQGFAVWDTLAIAEYVADLHPEVALWPRDARARARARSLCAEMHSGFGNLRSHCPQNIEAHLPEVGQRIWAEHASVQADVTRIQALWGDALASSGGPFLFGNFSIADAYYAPVVGRLRTYGLPVNETTAAYMNRVWASSGVAAWVAGALAEQEFLDFEEPYRKGR
jgi:glutathione S-transferase